MGTGSQVTVQSYALVKQSITFQHYWHYESWISNNTVIALGARHCNWPRMCSLEKRATFWQKQSVPCCLIQSHKVWEDPGSHHLFLQRISALKKKRQAKKVRHNRSHLPTSIQFLHLILKMSFTLTTTSWIKECTAGKNPETQTHYLLASLKRAGHIVPLVLQWNKQIIYFLNILTGCHSWR